MATTLENREVIKGFGPGVLDSSIKNHDNDPFVVKKLAKATETIKRVGLPGQKKK